MFHIGQKVVCIDTDIRPETRHPKMLNKLKRGNIYHISKIDKIGIQLVEIEPIHPRNYFFSDRFRPLIRRKTDISSFKELLTHNINEEV